MKVLRADYFDGRSTRVRVVDLSLVGEDLVIVGEDIDLRVPLARVQVDERLGRAPRKLHLRNGGFCEVRDLDALDRLLSSTTHRDGWVDRMQRHPRFILFSFVACALLAVAAYQWGLPWVAAEGARRLPSATARALSAQALTMLDGGILAPSKLPSQRRRALATEFHALRLPDGGTPASVLLFRQSAQLGANAFSLPDGTIVVLDDLITSLGDDRLILAILAHELGHAHERHGLKLLLQGSAAGALLTFYFGDISQLLAAAPAAVLQARYSRDFERQADDYGAALLLDNGMSPGLLADALQKLAQSHGASSSVGYLSSHPSTDERIRHLRRLAATSTVP